MPKKRKPSRTKARIHSTLEKEVQNIEKNEQRILQEEKKIEFREEKIQSQEQKIEKVLFRIWNFEFKNKHLLEIIKGIAGAFLGVGLGQNLLNKEELTRNLPWWNVIGILVFIIGISWILIYKNERDIVRKQGYSVVWRKLIFLYLIALVIEFLALWLFAALPTDTATLIKILIIGSYAAMAGAVSFSLI